MDEEKNIVDIMKDIREEIFCNLVTCCEELQQFEKTGILEDGKIREIVSKLPNVTSEGIYVIKGIIHSFVVDYIADNVRQIDIDQSR